MLEILGFFLETQLDRSGCWLVHDRLIGQGLFRSSDRRTSF